jgi:hypothetical protein
MQVTRDFISQDYIYLIVGASRDTTKWGYRILKTLDHYGYTVYGINPKYQEVDGIKCFESISKFKSQNSKLDAGMLVVVTVVPPEVTEKIVAEAVGLGIAKIWMQEGSEVGISVNQLIGESDKLVKIIAGKCIIRDGLGKPFVV